MEQAATLYRPPFERHSLLLPVTNGCSWGRCAFCSMYQDQPFAPVPKSQIKERLKEAADYLPDTRRVFLGGGDPLCLPFEQLEELLLDIRRALPACREVAMYASLKNILPKSDQQLERLRQLGLADLYIGVESGCDPVLERMNKGHTAQMALEQLTRLNRAQIPFFSILIYGFGGAGWGERNAKDTARLLSQVQSKAIVMMNLTVFPGTRLEQMCREGSFVEASPLERIQELVCLLEQLQVREPTGFSTSHITNQVVATGVLPQDRETLLAGLRAILKGEKPLNQIIG